MVDRNKIYSMLESKQEGSPPEPGFLGAISDFATETVPNFFTGADRTEFPEMPELGGTDVGGFSGAGYEVLAAMSANEMEQANMAAKMTGGTLTKDKFDNIILTVDGEPYYINKPGVSGRDLKDMGGQAALFIPAARVAGAAVKTGSVSMLGKSMAAGAGTEAFAEGTTAAAGADQSLGGAIGDVALSGLMNVAPSLPGFTQTRNTAQYRDNPYITIEDAESLMDKTGVGVLASQLGAKGVSNMVGENKLQYLRGLESTAPTIDAALINQQREIDNSVEGMLSGLPEPTNPGVKAQLAAQRARQAAVDAREKATGALYQQIRNMDGEVSTGPLLEAIKRIQRDDQLVEAGGSYRALEKVKDLIGRQTKEEPRTAPGATGSVTVEAPVARQPGQLQDAYQEVSELIQIAQNAGLNKQVRELTIAQKELDRVLNNSTGGTWREAQDTFTMLSQDIDFIDENLAGQILNMKPDQFDFVTKMVFSPKASKTSRANLKRILDGADPGAYPTLLRAHMEDKLMSITDTTISGNMPRQMLNAIWTNPKVRNMYSEELSRIDPELGSIYNALGDVLRFAMVGRGNNSNTQQKLRYAEEFERPLTSLIKRGVKLLTSAGMYGVVNDAVAAGKQSGALKTELSLISRDIKRLQKHLGQFEPGNSEAAALFTDALQSLSASLPFGEGPDGSLAE